MIRRTLRTLAIAAVLPGFILICWLTVRGQQGQT